jgi:pyridoxine 4-dehydrogenase
MFRRDGFGMTADMSAERAGSVQLGDRRIHRMGLGTNRVTDTESARAVLRRAVDLGVDFVDTADVYQLGASESTIGRVLGRSMPDVLVATKGGMTRTKDGRGVNGRPEYLRQAVADSLRRLNIDHVELYQLHHVDPDVPIETSVGALQEMQDRGLIRRIGLSNVTVDEIERARQLATIVSVQNRYNLLERQNEGVLDYCEAHSIVFIPWTPLLRAKIAESAAISGTAARYGVTPHQLGLRWLLKRSPVIVPIPGTTSVAHLEANLSAANVELTDADFRELSALSSPTPSS